MKFARTPRFERDWKQLPPEHQRTFRAIGAEFSAACDAFVQQRGNPWPARFRVSQMVGHEDVWEMTWSFAGPDGRATFEFIVVDGEPRVLWRRVGDHAIYRNP